MLGIARTIRLVLTKAHGARMQPNSRGRDCLEAQAFTHPTVSERKADGLSLRKPRPTGGLLTEQARSAALDIDGWLFRTESGGPNITANVFRSIIDHAIALSVKADATGLLSITTLPRPTRTAGLDVVAHSRKDKDIVVLQSIPTF